MRTLVIAIALSATAMVATAGAVQAQDRPEAAPMVIAKAPTGAIAAERPAAHPAPQPMDSQELAHLNGRQGSTSTILSDQDLTAVNRGNTITANTVGSGQVVIGSGAFAGFAGVGNFVINSGHNNNLQGALTINIVAPQ